MSSINPQTDIRLSEDINTSSRQIALSSNSRKRKRETALDKKPRQSIKKHRVESNKDDLDLTAGINNSFMPMDNQLLADYVAQRTRHFESDLSSVELADRYIPDALATVITDTTAWEKQRSLENLPAFLETFSNNPAKLWSASKKNGAPHTIIMAGASLRAADLARVIRKFQTKDVTVAKLFAKHIKIKDAIQFLKSTRTGVAVGTPTRISDLIDEGALAVDKLERIVIDASHIDQKKRGILEMRDTLVPLIQLLSRKQFKDRYGLGACGIDLLFY